MHMLYRRTSADELSELQHDPDQGALLLADGPSERLFDLADAWHGVHFLLTGSAWGGARPASDAVLGGAQVGDPTTYEPVRLLLPEEVDAVARHLQAQTPEVVTPRFTHRALQQAEIYPDAAWARPDALTAFLLPALARLTAFFGTAADDGDGVLVQLQRY